MSFKKFKKVKVQTPKGEKFLTFRPVIIPEESENEIHQLVCDIACPYAKVCYYLPDPRYPEDAEAAFCDFCSDLSEESGENNDNEVLGDMVPVEGELEKVFSEWPKFMDILLDKNPVYHLKSIISKVCPGMCEFYSNDCKNCSQAGELCILRDLIDSNSVGKSVIQKGLYDINEEKAKEIQDAEQRAREERNKKELEEINKLG